MKSRQPIKVKTHHNCEYSKCGIEFKKQNSFQKHCSPSHYHLDMAERGKLPKQKLSNPIARKPIQKCQKPITKKVKSLSDWKSDLEKEINLIVRTLDAGHDCICGQKRIKLITAGHYFSIGSNSTLRFNLLNIWGQDYDSNGEKGGEPIKFKSGLANLYGNEFIEELDALKSLQPLKLTSIEIETAIYICRSINKWLKLQDRRFSIQERLELRRKFNKQIGIY